MKLIHLSRDKEDLSCNKAVQSSKMSLGAFLTSICVQSKMGLTYLDHFGLPV